MEAPLYIETPERTLWLLRSTLKSIDPNGCWDDDDRERQNIEPLTIETAKAAIAYLESDENE